MSSLLASTGVKTLPDVSIGHSLVQMVVALVVILACIWGLGKVLTRLRSGPSSRAPKRRSAPGGLSVVSRQSLGKDLSIATVRWGEREVLVGIAGSTITFLDDARAEPAEPAARPGVAAGDAALAPGTAQSSAPTWARSSATEWADTAPAPWATQASAATTPRAASLLDSLRDATLRR